MALPRDTCGRRKGDWWHRGVYYAGRALVGAGKRGRGGAETGGPKKGRWQVVVIP